MIPVLLANEGAHAAMGVHDIVIVSSAVAVVVVLLITAAVGRAQLGVVPRGLGAVYEHIFDWVDGIARGFMGPEGRNYVPLAMSFFLFILFCNWGGLIPWPPIISYEVNGHPHHIPPYESPSASYSTTLALAILAFMAFMLLGLKKRIFPPASTEAEQGGHHGAAHAEHPGGLLGLWEWIGHYWQPTPKLWHSLDGALKYTMVPVLFFFFLGLNFIEEFARILSLSLRLYGNIYGEHMAKQNILGTMYDFLTSGDAIQMFLSSIVWVASMIVTLLGGLAGFIQAMVFMMLLLSYIAHAVADEH